MIIDKISNLIKYKEIIPNLVEGIEAIRSVGELPVGKYHFNKGYFLIQEGLTKLFDENAFEVHKKYIDIQIIVEGAEEIAWETIDKLKDFIPYDEENDKGKMNGQVIHQMLITKGMFWVAFPDDGHQAIAHSKTQHKFRKIVLKLPVSDLKGE